MRVTNLNGDHLHQVYLYYYDIDTQTLHEPNIDTKHFPRPPPKDESRMTSDAIMNEINRWNGTHVAKWYSLTFCRTYAQDDSTYINDSRPETYMLAYFIPTSTANYKSKEAYHYLDETIDALGYLSNKGTFSFGVENRGNNEHIAKKETNPNSPELNSLFYIHLSLKSHDPNLYNGLVLDEDIPDEMKTFPYPYQNLLSSVTPRFFTGITTTLQVNEKYALVKGEVKYEKYMKVVGVPMTTYDIINYNPVNQQLPDVKDTNYDGIPNNNDIAFNLTGLNYLRNDKAFRYVDGHYVFGNGRKKTMVISDSDHGIDLEAFDEDNILGYVSLEKAEEDGYPTIYILETNETNQRRLTDTEVYKYKYVSYEELKQKIYEGRHEPENQNSHGKHVSGTVGSSLKDIGVASDTKLFLIGGLSMSKQVVDILVYHKNIFNIRAVNMSWGSGPPIFIYKDEDKDIYITFYQESENFYDIVNPNTKNTIKVYEYASKTDFLNDIKIYTKPLTELNENNIITCMACGNAYYHIVKRLDIYNYNEHFEETYTEEKTRDLLEKLVKSVSGIEQLETIFNVGALTVVDNPARTFEFNEAPDTRQYVGNLASFSNRPFYPGFVTAPGEYVYSTIHDPTNTTEDSTAFKFMPGTSMASPFMTGCIALLQDVYLTLTGTMPSTKEEWRALIANTSEHGLFRDIYDAQRGEDKYTYDIVNVYNAVQYIYKNELKNRTIRNVRYVGSELSIENMDFSGTHFIGCTFDNVYLGHTNFNGCRFSGCKFNLMDPDTTVTMDDDCEVDVSKTKYVHRSAPGKWFRQKHIAPTRKSMTQSNSDARGLRMMRTKIRRIS